MTAATLATTAASCIAVSAASAALVDFNKCQYPIVKQKLLEDKTTGRKFIDGVKDICTRVEKSREDQSERTKKKGEVFTPSWLCKKMNDFIWAEIEGEFLTRCACDAVVRLPERSEPEGPQGAASRKGAEDAEGWKKIVDTRVLEITCGEAPYIVSRYDAATGAMIPVEQRIGILDRKLAIVNKNAADEKEWLKWTVRAYESVYGYECQRDSLAIARANLFLTFIENLKHRWNREATKGELCTIANRIAWNFWLMDGLKGVLPPGVKKPVESPDWFSNDNSSAENDRPLECVTYDWRARKKVVFNEIGRSGVMKFDYAIGNPPYQEEAAGTCTSDRPIYNDFMDGSFDVAEKVELITPARFLFNAGATPKGWNKKMLSDPHFKVLEYIQKSDEVFANTDIKGGVAITYRDVSRDFGEIGTFTSFSELNTLLKKVECVTNLSISDIVSNRGMYRFSPKAYEEQPHELKKASDARISTNAFKEMPSLFTEEKPNDKHDYFQMYGNLKGERVYRWFRLDYVVRVENLKKYKVMLPKANGSGAIGEVLSTPIIGTPMTGFTETFISIGAFDHRKEAEACLKYIKTKFARTMLGVLKITQDNTKPVWKKVPLQDFSSKSDIDWTVDISEIDKQLYKKYKLSKDEIKFIEEKVRAME